MKKMPKRMLKVEFEITGVHFMLAQAFATELGMKDMLERAIKDAVASVVKDAEGFSKQQREIGKVFLVDVDIVR